MKYTKDCTFNGKLMLIFSSSVQAVLLIFLIFNALARGRLNAVVSSFAGLLVICAETCYLFRSITREIDRACQEEYLHLIQYQNTSEQIREQSVSKQIEETRDMKEKLLDTISRMEDFLHTASPETESSESFQELAGNIKSIFDRTKKTMWCENTVINILMEDKKQIADQYHIRLDAALNVPEHLAVSLPDLCSVFANLLDNALEAANQTEDGEKWISARAAVVSGFFVLKIENPCHPGAKDLREQKIFRKKSGEVHGIGLRIVKRIAEKYGGKLITEESSGIFRSIVYLEYHTKEENKK